MMAVPGEVKGVAELVSPPVDASAADVFCVRFRYILYGRGAGSLAVMVEVTTIGPTGDLYNTVLADPGGLPGPYAEQGGGRPTPSVISEANCFFSWKSS